MGVLTLTSRLALVGTYTKALDLSTPREVIDYAIQKELTNGTGADQGNVVYSDSVTHTGSATINVTNASLKDAFGDVVELKKIKELVIVNKATTAGFVLLVSGSAIVGAAQIITAGVQRIGPGGFFAWNSQIDAVTVDASLATIIFDAGANSIAYEYVIAGNG